jgi:serine/threonine protein phosphatase PrpC
VELDVILDPICAQCGAPRLPIADEGFCDRCGASQTSVHDHVEIDAGRAAGVSDRGRVRGRNEDALYVEATDPDSVAVVVCDGVSSAADADVAARHAAAAAGADLHAAIAHRTDRLTEATRHAIASALRAVAELDKGSDRRGPPACTLVSAAVIDQEVVVGWVGDSRAYWIGDDLPRLLTTDDSWAQEQRRAGRMSRRDVATDPRAHRITRWLGADAPAEPPHIIEVRPETSGRLVLCSDGLWNYTRTAASIADLIATRAPAGGPIAVARALFNAALEAGGRDNVTVAVVDVEVRT